MRTTTAALTTVHTFVVPTVEQLQGRMHAAGEIDWLVEKLPPVLCREAGATKFRDAAAIMVELAIHDVTRDLPAAAVAALALHDRQPLCDALTGAVP